MASAENTLHLHQPLATVILQHDLPDGSHFDWMIATDPHARQPLATFRMKARLDQMEVGASAEIEPIAAHRPQYLNYEGEISGNRGCVRRMCRGQISRSSTSEPPDFLKLASPFSCEIVWQSPGGKPWEQKITLHQQKNTDKSTRWVAFCDSIRR